MAGSASNYLENELLDHTFQGATGSWTAPTTHYVALSTADPTDDGSGLAEPSGGSYARKSVTANSTNFPSASGGSMSNGTAITFATATASWGTITHYAIYDAASGGNMLCHGDLSTSKTVGNGDTVSFAVGELVLTMS